MEHTSECREDTLAKKPSKHICIGILAHVDAGKTTLSEAMLYLSGATKRLGRVDHRDTFLDTFEMEKERGITIFSKQAVFELGDLVITLLDTPGHIDFSAEMERTLKVLDYAVLVISGADGVQGHAETLWRLLNHYRIPVFIFVNKMDQEGTDRVQIMRRLCSRLSSDCVEFGADTKEEAFYEQIALCDEDLMEHYLNGGNAGPDDIAGMIKERKVFPCYFGSALKLDGVREFLQGLVQYIRAPFYGSAFAAKVYKIARDGQGNRLTYMKVTGGSLSVKDTVLQDHPEEGREPICEKVDQIRIYSGEKYKTVMDAGAGVICAVTGLTGAYPGQGLGAEADCDVAVLEPVLNYRIVLPESTDTHWMLRSLRQLEEEEPSLHIMWNETLDEIQVKLMGEVQVETLGRLIWERFGVRVQFDSGNIVYKETVTQAVEGVGHFEPLRHYAEVHLLLEPLPPGSGLEFAADVSEDELDLNWQRLILSHLAEKEHVGILTGSPITDMRITLIAGRGHQKHTEGGDFRQATYRAVRHGLKKAGCILLEPYYEFRLEVPVNMVGRAMSDIQRMSGSCASPETSDAIAVLTGSAPVYCMRGYQSEVTAYTKGRGRLSCMPHGYRPCHNAEEVIEAAGYNSDRDTENPTGSVFCARGSGFNVSWDQVEDYMHIECRWQKDPFPDAAGLPQPAGGFVKPGNYASDTVCDDKELEEIFVRTYGPIKRKQAGTAESPAADHSGAEKAVSKSGTLDSRRSHKTKDEYLLVDGYNIIFAWDELKELAELDIMAARDRLMHILSNYQGYMGMTLIVVFDAYKVQGNPGSVSKYHNIYVVYTKEAETADQYIEKTVHKIGRKAHVTVATSDALEQVIILGQGGHRISAAGLEQEIRRSRRELIEEHLQGHPGGRSYLLDRLSKDTADYVDKIMRE